MRIVRISGTCADVSVVGMFSLYGHGQVRQGVIQALCRKCCLSSLLLKLNSQSCRRRGRATVSHLLKYASKCVHESCRRRGRATVSYLLKYASKCVLEFKTIANAMRCLRFHNTRPACAEILKKNMAFPERRWKTSQLFLKDVAKDLQKTLSFSERRPRL